MNRSKVTAREAGSGGRSEFKPYQVGMQVSCGVDPEVSEKDLVWGAAKAFGINIPRSRRAEGVPGDGRASFARSYPHDFWARGYFVSAVGADEETIREHIWQEEQEDCRLDRMSTLFWGNFGVGYFTVLTIRIGKCKKHHRRVGTERLEER